jgi:hypothetical protein
VANYYISNSGSASNTGLSAAQAWTPAKAQSFDTGGGFLPGDKILWNKGETISGTFTFHCSGSSGSPITFDLYGTATNNVMFDAGGANAPCITFSGSYITINNICGQNSTSTNGIFYFYGPNNHDITVNNCYVTGGYRGLYFNNCGSGGVANLLVKNCYFYNIGVGGTRASGSGSACQMVGCSGSGIEVATCWSEVDMSLTEAQRDGVGDVFNFYQCNGTAASYILTHDLKVRGGGSNSGGYAGLILGDKGGSYQNGYNNIFVKSGAEGAQVQGGTNIILNNNQMYSPMYDYCFEGIGFGNYSGAPCNNITITNNKISWINKGGSAIAWYQDNSGASTSTGIAGGAALSVDWSTNTSQYSTDGTMTDALLPSPLWTGSPWNTITGTAPTISYSPSSYSFTVGNAISNISPTYSGDAATGWSISPALPTGLSFNTSTGVISGTPTVTSGATNYTVTATNATGNGTTILSIATTAVAGVLLLVGRRFTIN